MCTLKEASETAKDFVKKYYDLDMSEYTLIELESLRVCLKIFIAQKIEEKGLSKASKETPGTR